MYQEAIGHGYWGTLQAAASRVTRDAATEPSILEAIYQIAATNGAKASDPALSWFSGSADTLQNQMGIRDTKDIFANVWFDFSKVPRGEFQIFPLGANVATPIAGEQKPLGSRLAGRIATIVRDHPSAGPEGSVSEAKEILRFRIVEVMYQSKRKNDVERTQTRHRVLAHSFADELPPIAVTLPRGGNVRRVGIHTEVLALGEKWQHVAWPAADIQYAIVRLWPNVLTYKYPAAVIGADQRVIELVKEWTIQDRSKVLDHIGHR